MPVVSLTEKIFKMCEFFIEIQKVEKEIPVKY
jgi:hypothetical protein